MIAFRQFPNGVTALFEEAPGGGDIRDINSLRNRPAAHPEDWLDKVLLHSEFDLYQVAIGPIEVTVNHAAVAGASTDINLPSGFTTIIRQGQIVESHIDLLDHGLPYVPNFRVISDGEIITNGTLVQSASSRLRTVSPYATASKIRLKDVGTSSASTLAALSKTYQVLVYRDPVADSDKLLDFDRATGRTILALGKFDSSRKMLRQAGAGDSAFDVPLGRTIDIRNGRARSVLANGTTVTETGYDGTFAGSGSIQCAVE
jgi:hypothetical protein